MVGYATNLEQTCPCGLNEAAGDYCTHCGRKSADFWFKPEASEEVQARMARARQARVKAPTAVNAPNPRATQPGADK